MPEPERMSLPVKESADKIMNKRKATAHAERGGNATKKRRSSRIAEKETKYVPHITVIGGDLDDENWYDSDSGDDEDNDNNGDNSIVNSINKDNPYWQSSEAADLFGFDHGTDVYNELKQQIETFKTVIRSRSDIRHYSDCGEGTWIIPVDIFQSHKDKTALTEEDKEELWVKCVHLRSTYMTALEELNRISTWAECCEKTYSKIMIWCGIGGFAVRSGRTIEEWNRDFRVNHKVRIGNQP